MRCVLSILVVLTVGCLVSPAQEPSFQITGIIKHLDVKVGTVSIRPKRKFATRDETFSFLKKDIDITTPTGQKAQLETLKLGQTVMLTIGPSGDVEAVAIQELSFTATIADVDPVERNVKIAQNKSESTILPVANAARINIAGKSVFLREIKLGSEMTVITSLDGKTILGMNMLLDPDGKLATKLYPRVKFSRLPGARFPGVLSDIDVGQNALRVTGPKTKNVPRKWALAKDAILQAHYGQVVMQAAELKDIRDRARGTVFVSAEDQITRVILDSPTQRTRVKSVEGDAGRLTVTEEGMDKTYALHRGVKIMNGTRVMRLSDIAVDSAVTLVFSLDQKLLLAVDMK